MQWQPSGALWHIFNTRAQQATPPWKYFYTGKNGHQCKAMKLTKTSELQSPLKGHRSDSPQKRSARASCAQAVPWQTSWRKSKHTILGWWGDGREMQCSTTSTPSSKVLHHTLRRAWSNTGAMRSFNQPTGDSDLFSQV